jgi:hypothetical protein
MRRFSKYLGFFIFHACCMPFPSHSSDLINLITSHNPAEHMLNCFFCPFMCMQKQLENSWLHLRETWCWGVLQKVVEPFEFWLKFASSNKPFTWRPLFAYVALNLGHYVPSEHWYPPTISHGLILLLCHFSVVARLWTVFLQYFIALNKSALCICFWICYELVQ